MTLIDSPVTVVDDYAPLAQCAVPKRQLLAVAIGTC